MKKLVLSIVAMLLPMLASADAVAIGGIYYNLVSKAKQAEVTSNPNKYSGDVIIPKSVPYDGIDYSVTSIGERAFELCSDLTSITIPGSVTSIGEGAFSSCSGLTSITIPNSVTTIGNSVFACCIGLTSITIPNSVTSISNYAFLQCSGLTSITIPNSVNSIGDWAFLGCSSLTSVTIPNSVTRINERSFEGCSSLTSITIPNSVEYIDNEAFRDCSGLTSVTIGSGVYSIAVFAFANCKELADVYCLARNVPYTDTNAFQDSYVEYITLHVPSSSIDNYKNTEPWSRFKEIVKIIIPEHTLTYIVDGQTYKTYSIEEGETIIPEPAPTKEGYTFSGWSAIPSTMPENDVTVTGTFSINKYMLTYIVDGVEYKTEEVEYGATITPEPDPTKNGFTFSGWSYIPSTMPANDVTVTGTFTKVTLGKCATPTISIENGKVKFACDTKDVEYLYDIVSLDAMSGGGNDIDLKGLQKSYRITVYATKTDYDDSDAATMDFNLKGDGDANGDGIVNAADIVSIVNIIMAN